MLADGTADDVSGLVVDGVAAPAEAGLGVDDPGVGGEVVLDGVQASTAGSQATPTAPTAIWRNRLRSIVMYLPSRRRYTSNQERLARRSGWLGAGVSDTAAVRLTDFWERMRAQFGRSYADSFARDYVLSELGGRTVREALDQGEDIVTVWRAVCRTVEVEPNLR
jgi:hypothetical protein